MPNRVRVGVVGCGAIAQIHHLPNLLDIDGFELTGVCDISAQLVAAIGKRYSVEQTTTDYRELLSWDLDAVVCCHADPKTEVVLAALQARKHVFVEKPVCFSMAALTTLTDAAAAAKVVAQAGYVKVYDPAFEIAEREVAAMRNVKLAMATHIHTDNAMHLGQFDLLRFEDIGAAQLAEHTSSRQAAIGEGLQGIPGADADTFLTLNGSVVHDFYSLRHLLGEPNRVVSAETLPGGNGIVTVLAYPGDVRGVVTWVNLTGVWHFDETLNLYADDRRLLLESPTGFARGVLTGLTIEGVDEAGTSFARSPQVAWETAFRRELRHFHSCIAAGAECKTPLASAGAEIGLSLEVMRCLPR